jgi:hypothetical protein
MYPIVFLIGQNMVFMNFTFPCDYTHVVVKLACFPSLAVTNITKCKHSYYDGHKHDYCTHDE